MTTLRESVLRAAINRQRGVIQDFQQRIKDATANDGNVNEEEYDNQKQAFEAQVLDEVNLLNEQLHAAERDLGELEKIAGATPDDDVVSFGKVVKTDKRTFFISAGMQDFDVHGQTISGVSIHSPIYHSMRGKRVGERFIQSGISYTIREVL